MAEWQMRTMSREQAMWSYSGFDPDSAIELLGWNSGTILDWVSLAYTRGYVSYMNV